MGRYGSVEISLLYDAPMRKMTVHVLQARGIPCRDKQSQPTHTQVSETELKRHNNSINLFRLAIIKRTNKSFS